MLDRRSFLRTATGVGATLALQSRLLEAVTVRVHKPAAPIPGATGAAAVAVEVQRARESAS